MSDEPLVDTVIGIRVDAVIADIVAGRVPREAMKQLITECCKRLAAASVETGAVSGRRGQDSDPTVFQNDLPPNTPRLTNE